VATPRSGRLAGGATHCRHSGCHIREKLSESDQAVRTKGVEEREALIDRSRISTGTDRTTLRAYPAI
jgi:hypothetical protein